MPHVASPLPAEPPRAEAACHRCLCGTQQLCLCGGVGIEVQGDCAVSVLFFLQNNLDAGPDLNVCQCGLTGGLVLSLDNSEEMETPCYEGMASCPYLWPPLFTQQGQKVFLPPR